MWTDVVDLQEFYNSRLGRVARHVLRQSIRDIWPDLNGRTLLGLGYATPYLEMFEGDVENLMAVMPASQGVHHWPRDRAGKVVLADEAQLPLPDYSVDRVLLVHGLESTEYVRDMLQEIWRVLTGEGRLLIVAPSRRGIWARIDKTPFGWGHPFSRHQVMSLLRDTSFQMLHTERTLYTPPSHSAAILRSSPAWERLGKRLAPSFGGVLMVEATKQLYAPTPRRREKRLQEATVGFPRPVIGTAPQSLNRAGLPEGLKDS
ncbi:class I SAM-dependent methyltransferase [Kiloniella sp. b19]|uniref:class I SAM-dependent methyltransferase n=1 Tax=Kiloniella sp. GXU_MW_B19 TaxID=3141326 RepID=UPI0031CFB9CB